MTTYSITSAAWATWTYEAETPAAALLALHRDAGYDARDCWLDSDGELVFRDEATRALLGGLDAWTVRAL